MDDTLALPHKPAPQVFLNCVFSYQTCFTFWFRVLSRFTSNLLLDAQVKNRQDVRAFGLVNPR
jgi:hypothetical protein